MKKQIIVCPKCGAEYLPAEIYMPNKFLGKPSDIIKDANGKIISFSGDSIIETESYICDYCDTAFDVKAEMTFVTDLGTLEFFKNDYSRTISKPFILKEN